MVWSDGAKYCGEWKLGKTCGLGHELYGDASVYLGQFQNDLVIFFFLGLALTDGAKHCGEWRSGR